MNLSFSLQQEITKRHDNTYHYQYVCVKFNEQKIMVKAFIVLLELVKTINLNLSSNVKLLCH